MHGLIGTVHVIPIKVFTNNQLLLWPSTIATSGPGRGGNIRGWSRVWERGSWWPENRSVRCGRVLARVLMPRVVLFAVCSDLSSPIWPVFAKTLSIKSRGWSSRSDPCDGLVEEWTREVGLCRASFTGRRRRSRTRTSSCRRSRQNLRLWGSLQGEWWTDKN